MREILFRGKQKYNGKWIYGCLVKLGKESFSDIDRYGIIDKGIPIMNVSCCYNFGVDEVIPETTGQYTGLTDRNGVKIFEGDILKSTFCDLTFLYVVRFRYGEFEAVSQKQSVIASCGFSQREVIGNIHDNSELLRGEVIDG